MQQGLAVILAALTATASLSAQSAKNERLRIECVDVAGQPVQGAELYVWQYRPLPVANGQMTMAGPFITDADGFANTVVALTFDGGRFDRWIYARVPNKLVGAARDLNLSSNDTVPATRLIKVRLQPSRNVQGNVVVPKGMDCSKVRIRVQMLNGILDGDLWAQPFPRQTSIESLHHTLPERFECGVLADGSFAFTDMPKQALLYLAAEGPGLAQMQWSNAKDTSRRIPASIQLEMETESVLAGKLSQPNGQPCANAELLFRIEDVPSAWSKDTFKTRTDATGTFRLTGLPGGDFSLSIRADAGVFRPTLVRLGPQEQRVAEQLRLEAGVEVRGRVVEHLSGKAIEGANVTALSDNDHHTQLGHSRSDAQGRFSMRLPKGTARIYFSGIPEGFAYPEPQIVTTLEIDEPDPELTKMQLQLSRK